MQPKVSQTCARSSLGFRDLICMMHRNVILTAAMNVKIIAQILLRHRRTLDMPARETYAPWAIPLHLPVLVGTRKFPEGKVRWTPLFTNVNSVSRLQPFYVQSRQMSVIIEFARVKINAVRCFVSEPFLFNVGNKSNLLWDVVGSLAPYIRVG